MTLALTGPDGDTGALGAGLRALGVATVSAPLVEAVPVRGAAARWKRLLGGGRRFDAVVFASPRAVDAFASLPGAAAVRFRAVFAVGEETARRARAAGLAVRPWRAVVGRGPGAAGLLDALDAAGATAVAGAAPGSRRAGPPARRADPVADLRGRTLLLPGSARARPDLARGLRERGATVVGLDLYTVRSARHAARRVEALLAAAPTAVLVASPSAAAALAALPRAARDRLPPLIAIGPTTAAALEAVGLLAARVAARPTPEGVRAAMEVSGMDQRTPPRFPVVRPRRLRRGDAVRAMVRETALAPEHLVAPLFVVPGAGVREPVASMPGVERLSPDLAAREAAALRAVGVRAVILFGVVPDGMKTPDGAAAADPDGPVARAVRAVRAAAPDLHVWADVCLCEYTDHGHCAPLDARGDADNDAALPLLARAATAYARAGADAVCPSDMMDGRVAALRAALDAAGFAGTAIVSYAVKYASAFYGPFRDAAGSAPRSGDRRGYQMDPANAREALREAALDEAEGADVLMVKPALACLDIVRRVRDATTLPVAAYCVSGEYAMIEAAAARGWIDRDRVLIETLLAARRAGADLVVTYHAREAARLLARARPPETRAP